MENTAGKIFTELKEDISTYARLKLRLLKLMAIERTAIVLAVLSHSLILLLLSFFTVLFLFVALGCYLGELLDSPALGFPNCQAILIHGLPAKPGPPCFSPLFLRCGIRTAEISDHINRPA